MAVPNNKNNFNFLRLFFASLVLLAHAPELADGNNEREILSRIFGTATFGDLAVNGFFILSGYLIVQSWIRTPVALDFMQKRVLRIFPGFILASLVCAFIVGPLAGSANYFHDFSPVPFTVGFLLLQQPVLPSTFANTHFPVTNGAMWTISLEFYCYLLVLAMGVLGIVQRRVLWAALTCAVFMVLLLWKLGHPLPDMGTGLLSNGPFAPLAGCFLTGGCFFLFNEKIIFTPKLATIAAILLVACMFSWRASGFALTILGAYLLFYFAFTDIRPLAKFDQLPDVSFGVYLYGFPVQKILLWYVPAMSPWVLFPLSLLASLVLGATSWYSIEKPLLRLKKKRPAVTALA